jgi:FkbM family methyltransferase
MSGKLSTHYRSLSRFGAWGGFKVALGTVARKVSGLFSAYDLISKTTFDFLLRSGATIKRKNNLINIQFKPSFAPGPVTFNVRSGTTDIIIFNEILQKESYKPALELQRKLNRDIKYIVDAGANIGTATVYFKTLFPEASVVSIEPADSNYDVLKANIEDNSFKNVNPVKAAVWNKDENLEIRDFFRGEREKELSFFVEESEGNGTKGSYVRGVTIESIMSEFGFPQIDLLKVDIEGAETKIFNNPDSYFTLLSKVGILAIEIHEEVFDKWKFVQELESRGFNQISFGEILYVYKD